MISPAAQVTTTAYATISHAGKSYDQRQLTVLSMLHVENTTDVDSTDSVCNSQHDVLTKMECPSFFQAKRHDNQSLCQSVYGR